MKKWPRWDVCDISTLSAVPSKYMAQLPPQLSFALHRRKSHRENPPGDELIYVRTFTDEDVALNVDDVVLGETVHGDLCFGVTFVVVDEIRGYLLLRAPADLHVQMRTMRRIYFSNNNHNKLI